MTLAVAWCICVDLCQGSSQAEVRGGRRRGSGWRSAHSSLWPDLNKAEVGGHAQWASWKNSVHVSVPRVCQQIGGDKE